MDKGQIAYKENQSDDQELKNNIEYFIESNKYFNRKFIEFKIKRYDVSKDRKKLLTEIINKIITSK